MQMKKDIDLVEDVDKTINLQEKKSLRDQIEGDVSHLNQNRDNSLDSYLSLLDSFWGPDIIDDPDSFIDVYEERDAKIKEMQLKLGKKAIKYNKNDRYSRSDRNENSNRDRDREDNRDRDRYRDRDRDRYNDRDKDLDRDRYRGDRDKNRDRDIDRYKDRDRDIDRYKDKDRDINKNRYRGDRDKDKDKYNDRYRDRDQSTGRDRVRERYIESDRNIEGERDGIREKNNLSKENISLSSQTTCSGDESDIDQYCPQPPSEKDISSTHSQSSLKLGHHGRNMLKGEAEKIGEYVTSGERIPRRGEVGLTSAEISSFEQSGFIMSGSRHARMNAVRIRKENQLYSAQEERALANLNKEARDQREREMMESLEKLLKSKHS